MKKIFLLTIKRVLWKDKLSFFLVFFGLVVNLLCFFILWWQIKPDETGTVLHYNVFFGIDAISFDLENFYYQLFLAPAGAFAVWLLNFVLGFALYFQVISDREKEKPEYAKAKREKAGKRELYLDFLDAKMLSGYLLWAGALVVQVALAIYVLAIVMVNR